MFHRTILAMAAFCCLSFAAQAAECPSIAGLAAYMDGNEKGARIIEVVPVNSASIDHLVIYVAESGNVMMMPEFNGCLFGEPVMIDVKRPGIPA